MMPQTEPAVVKPCALCGFPVARFGTKERPLCHSCAWLDSQHTSVGLGGE